MIAKKTNYMDYLKADFKANGVIKNSFIKRSFYSEKYILIFFITLLRKSEHYSSRSGLLNKAAYCYYYFRFKRLGFKLAINLPLHKIGPGLTLHHIGPIIVHPHVTIGSHCTLQPGVVIGQTKQDETPTVGNNVYFAPGAKAFGKLRIGNHVIIAPNSNVIKDVADYSVMSGVPAQLIKKNEIKLMNDVV